MHQFYTASLVVVAAVVRLWVFFAMLAVLRLELRVAMVEGPGNGQIRHKHNEKLKKMHEIIMVFKRGDKIFDFLPHICLDFCVQLIIHSVGIGFSDIL